MESDNLAVRKRGDREAVNIKEDDFISQLKKDIKERN